MDKFLDKFAPQLIIYYNGSTMTESMKAPAGTYGMLKDAYRRQFDPESEDSSHGAMFDIGDGVVEVSRQVKVRLVSREPFEAKRCFGSGMDLTIYKYLKGFAGVVYRARVDPDDLLLLLTASPDQHAISLGLDIPPADINYMLRILKVALGSEIS